LQRLDTIVSSLRHKMTNGSASVDDLKRLATVYEQTGKTSELVDTLKTGLLKYPEDPDLRLRLADFFMERKDYLEGAKVLEKSGLVKTNLAAMQMYLEFLVQAQKFGDADKFFSANVPTKARETELFLNLRAAIAEGLDRKNEAQKIYRQLYEMKPGNMFYAMNYARFLADGGRTKEALAILEKFRASPRPETMKLMAQVLATAGRYKEAEEWQLRYLRSTPTDLPQAFGFLGDVRLSRGDKVNARRAYEKGLEAMLKEVSQGNNPRGLKESSMQGQPERSRP
jgi:predicted Zn-dependent protease